MKIFKVILYTIILFFSISINIILYRYLSIQELDSIKYKNHLDSCEKHKEQILNNIKNIILSNNITLSDFYLTDINNRKITLRKIIKKKTLVYRFSEIACQACVKNDINIINSLCQGKDSINVIILCDYAKIKNMKIFHQINNCKTNIYSCLDSLNLKVENKEYPYYFILDTSLCTTGVFISNSNLTKEDNYFLYEKEQLNN